MKKVKAKRAQLIFLDKQGKKHICTYTDKIEIWISRWNEYNVEKENNHKTRFKWLNDMKKYDKIKDDNGEKILWKDIDENSIKINKIEPIRYRPKVVKYWSE